MDNITTSCGGFEKNLAFDTYETGEIKNIRFDNKNIVSTLVGDIVPLYVQTHRTKNRPSIEFYKNGNIMSVYLNEQQQVETSIGKIPAEFITFYDSGEIKRIFPLNGQISGYWSVEEENLLNTPIKFNTKYGEFSAKLIGAYFYKSGALSSLTLFPNEVVRINVNNSKVKVRIGLSFYENGNIKSYEPSVPTEVMTPIGKIKAFDINAVGVNGDSNSLNFDENGEVTSIVSCYTKVGVKLQSGEVKWYSPKIIPPIFEEEGEEIESIKISFKENNVNFNGEKQSYSLNNTQFLISSFYLNSEGSCGLNCSSCSSCSSKQG